MCRIFQCFRTAPRRATNDKDDIAAVREKVKSLKTRPAIDLTKLDNEQVVPILLGPEDPTFKRAPEDFFEGKDVMPLIR